MNTNPQVRVIKHFRSGNMMYNKGDVFTPWGTFRDVLLARGLVEIIKPEDVGEVVAASVAPPVKLPRASRKPKAIAGGAA